MKRVWILVLLVLFSSCERRVSDILDGVEACMQAHPDSALALLRSIDTTALRTPATKARYALLHATALDKNWIDTTDVGVVMPAVRYYDRRKPVTNRAKPWYYLGCIQYNGRNYDEAIISFTRAKAYAEELDDDRFKALVHQAISDTYDVTYLYEESLKYAQEAYKYVLRSNDTTLTHVALFPIAVLHYNLKNYHAADSLLTIVVNSDRDKINPNTLSQVLACYAQLSANYKNDYSKAVALFDEALSIKNSFVNSNFWGIYAYSLYQTGNREKSEQIFKKMEDAGLKDQFAYQIWKSRTEQLKGNYRTAFDLLEKSSQEQTDGVMKLLRQSTIKAQRDYFILENDTLKRENIQRKTINILLVIAILTSAIAVFVIVRHYREHARQKNQQLMEAAQDMVEQSEVVKNLSAEIDNIARQQARLKQEFFRLNQENFKELSDLCNTYYKTEGRSSQAHSVCGEVRGLLKSLGVGEDWYAAFEQRVNEMFDHVMEHFRAEHPAHREQYFQTACYLFAGFKTRTIALLLHLSEQEVYQVRWRLKKEIESTPAPHQSDFLTLLNGPAK